MFTEFFKWRGKNLAERALRIAKGKHAAVGQFQALNALFYYAAILLYLETCKKNGVNLFDALKRLFEGNTVMPEEMLPKEIVERMQETRQEYMMDDQGKTSKKTMLARVPISSWMHSSQSLTSRRSQEAKGKRRPTTRRLEIQTKMKPIRETCQGRIRERKRKSGRP